jgi:GWxTD domain-containing protein
LSASFLIMAFIVGIVIFGCGLKPESGAESDFLQRNYELAESLFVEGDYQEAERLLKINLAANHHHSRSHFLLGEIYRQKDTIIYRRLSATSLKQAVRKNPDNPEYRYSLGLTYQKQGFSGNALRQFKKVIELDPQHTQAHRHIAEIYEKMALRYDDQVNFNRSLEHASSAASIGNDPQDFCDQAKILIQLDLFNRALTKADTALMLDPPDKLARQLYLIRGLCNVRLEAFYDASADFDSAMAFMNQNALTDFEDIRFVVSPAEYNRLRSLSSYRRKAKIARLWGELDPDPTTSVNERKLEHYARQVYADLTFSIPEKQVRGKNTKRGEMVIRYGIPDEKRYFINDNLILTWEWDYIINGAIFTLHFEDTFHNGNFDFPYTSTVVEGGDSLVNMALVADQLARAVAQKYDFEKDMPVLNFAYMVKQFKGNHGKTEMEIFYNVPYNEITFRKEGDIAIGDFDVRAAIHDGTWSLLDSISFSRVVKVAAGQTSNVKLAVSHNFTLNAYPDSIYLSMAVVNPHNNHTGRSKTIVGLRSFYVDKVTMSELVLGRMAILPVDEMRISRKNIQFFTNLDNRYFVAEPVVVYFEFYNLTKSDDNRTHYQIKQVIANLKKPKLIGRLIGGYKVAEEVVTVYDGSGMTTYENRLLTLDLSNFKKGRYRITIEIQDLVSGETASASEDIILYE